MYNIYDDFERVNESLAEVLELSSGKLYKARHAAGQKSDAYFEIRDDAKKRSNRLSSPRATDPDTGMSKSTLNTVAHNANDIGERKYDQSRRFFAAAKHAKSRETARGLAQSTGGKRYSLI